MDIAFILVEPKRGQHVGAAARALRTMGFRDLRLVGAARHNTTEARALAHGSVDILAATRVYPSLAAAVEDVDFVVGTSAKDRHHRRYYHSPEQLSTLLQKKRPSLSRTAVVFGREDHGLGKDEIALCDVVSQIPLASPYPSLNLAQAVMVYCYSLASVNRATAIDSADADQYRSLKPKLARLLTHAGIAEREKTWLWAMERLAQAQHEDIGFLHFVCDKLSQKIEN